MIKCTRRLSGECTDMCPQKELRMRCKERLLHRYELGRFEPVKEFSRPAAGQATPQPRDIRTGSTLLRTTEYLINTIFSQETEPLNVVFDFVFDRLRAVRQDMVLQSLSDETACRILAIIVRFHVMSSYLLSELPVDKFDPAINSSHLLECTKMLLVLQDENEVSSFVREEIAAIYILSNLSSPAPFYWALEQPKTLRTSETISASLSLGRLYRERNFVRYFRILATLPSLLQISARQFSERMVIFAVKNYCTAYHSPNCKYPRKKFAQMCSVDANVITDVCAMSSVECDAENIRFHKGTIAQISDDVRVSGVSYKVDRRTILHGSNAEIEKKKS